MRELCKGNKCFVITLIPLALLKDLRRLVGLDFEPFHPFFVFSGFSERWRIFVLWLRGLLEGLGSRCICLLFGPGYRRLMLVSLRLFNV